jgi:hypothetical protein
MSLRLHLRRACAAALGLSISATASAGIEIANAHLRLGFERIELPGRETMGLLGTSYLVDVKGIDGLSLGPAVYGAITGRRGGFYTIGGEIAWRRQISGPLGLEAGLYVGGGGGGGAPQGGGLMLRPHLDLLWDMGGHLPGLSLSQVKFPNGQIKSTQVGLVWNVLTDFRYLRGSSSDTTNVANRSGLGFDRIQAVLGRYYPRGRSGRASGGALPGHIGYAGVRAEQALDASLYWGIEANGAASGGVAGYAEYLATLGWETNLLKPGLSFGGRLALGMGGGGDVSVGGGLLAKASLHAGWRFTRTLGLTLEGGVAASPDGDFKAPFAAAALTWHLDAPPTGDLDAPNRRTEFSSGLEQYDAPRRDGGTRRLQAIALKINRYVTPAVYLTGQAHSATGGGAGGYSSGLLGVGASIEPIPRLQLSAEFLTGAAGGGGVETRGGLVTQPMAYASWRLNDALSLRVGAGRIRAAKGPLDSTVVDAALVFSFGVTNRAAR